MELKVQDHAKLSRGVGPSPESGMGRSTEWFTESDESYFGSETPDTSPSEEKVSGQSDPGEDASKYKVNKLKKVGIYGFMCVLFILVMLIPNFISYINKQGNGGNVNVSEQQNINQLNEIKHLKQQISLLQNNNEETIAQIDRKVEQRIRDIMSNSAEVKGDDAKLDALIESNRLMQEQIKKLSEENIKKEPPQPKKGSSSSSVAFTLVAQKKEEKALLEAKIAEEVKNTAPDYDIRPGMQVGMTIPAVLDTTIMSSLLLDRYYVSSTTQRDIEIAPGYILPRGTKFLGKPTSDFESRRIVVDINKVQYGSSELNLKGVLLDGRQSPGLVTKYVDPMNSAIWAALPLSIASATAAALQDTATYYNSNTGQTYESTAWSGKNAVLEGTAEALSNVTEIITEMHRRKKPVIIVRSGIDVNVQISEKLPLDRLIASGIVRPVAR